MLDTTHNDILINIDSVNDVFQIHSFFKIFHYYPLIFLQWLVNSSIIVRDGILFQGPQEARILIQKL